MTIDPFVLLAPVLLLVVIALLGFVGCNWVFGVRQTSQLKDITVTFANKPPQVPPRKPPDCRSHTGREGLTSCGPARPMHTCMSWGVHEQRQSGRAIHA